MTEISMVEQRRIARRIAECPDGMYRLARDVPNPARDKRRRYGSDVDAGPEVYPANQAVLVERIRSGEVVLKVGKTSVRFHVHEIPGADACALPGAAGGPKGERVAIDLLDALSPAERSWDALAYAIDRKTGGGGWARRALRRLVESGKITLDDVERASAEAEDALIPAE